MPAIINPLFGSGGGGGGGVTLSQVQTEIQNALSVYDADGNNKIDAVAQESFPFEQTTPSATWTIMHNLNGYPQARVRDAAGTPLEVSFDYPDQNTMNIYFASPTAGVADLSL